MHFLNPLQWNFGPRTVATLLTWATLPGLIAVYIAWGSFSRGATEAGLNAAQIDLIMAGMVRGLLWMSLPMVVVCVVASLLFARIVVQPLHRLQVAMKQIEQGNLTERKLPVTSRDEVGQITRSYNTMSASLHVIIVQMAEAARGLDEAGSRLRDSSGQTKRTTEHSRAHIEQVRRNADGQVAKAMQGAKATEEMRQAVEQVASGADAQAREVEIAANTVREVATAIEQVANSAGVVSEAAGKTRAAADDGRRAVVAVVGGMDQVEERVLAAAAQVQELSASLTHVDDILRLITELADQTDLLALNAAIEAARVGEHGRGFAVVAGEVRRLSDRSRRAAEEIAGRVEQIRTGARDVVITMEKGTKEVQSGVVLARDAGASLERILEAVTETQRQVESISAAAEEISAASHQVVSVTHQLSAIAEENAATAGQMVMGVRSVSGLITDVEQEARTNQQATLAMVEQADLVNDAVTSVAASAAQVQGTAAMLQERVGGFRLQ